MTKGHMMNFVIVNCGTSFMTNVVIKNILLYHGDEARIFIVDVDRTRRFSIVDESSFVTVIDGLTKDEIILQPFCCLGEIVHPNVDGDIQHLANTQFAMDYLKDSFVLLDSDAIPTRRMDFVYNQKNKIISSMITIHKQKKMALTKEIKDLVRFDPFVQGFNYPMFDTYGIRLFHQNIFADNLDVMFKCNSKYNKIKMINGVVLYKDIVQRNIPFQTINGHDYVYHIGNYTWNKHKNAHLQDILMKYEHLFINKKYLLHLYDIETMDRQEGK